MKAKTGSVLETLRRVQDFLDANAALLGPAVAPSARKNLDDAVEQLSTHGATQDGSSRNSRGETARQRQLRLAVLRNHMKPISVLALQHLRDVPQFLDLRMPVGHASAVRVVNAARGMADAASIHAQVLVDAGLPADFVERLREAATALEDSKDARNVHRRTRAGSTAGLIAQEKRGRAIVRVLDARVRPALGSNDTLLAEWESVSKIDKKPGRAAGAASSDDAAAGMPPATTTTATSTTSTTPATQQAA